FLRVLAGEFGYGCPALREDDIRQKLTVPIALRVGAEQLNTVRHSATRRWRDTTAESARKQVRLLLVDSQDAERYVRIGNRDIDVPIGLFPAGNLAQLDSREAVRCNGISVDVAGASQRICH